MNFNTRVLPPSRALLKEKQDDGNTPAAASISQSDDLKYSERKHHNTDAAAIFFQGRFLHSFKNGCDDNDDYECLLK